MVVQSCQRMVRVHVRTGCSRKVMVALVVCVALVALPDRVQALPGSPAPATSVATSDSALVPNERSVTQAVIPFNGTNPDVPGQIGVGITMGNDSYDPCNPSDTFYRACTPFGYWHVTQGSMNMPAGIVIPNSEPAQQGPAGTVNHGWANKVRDGRIEIYPFGSGGNYDPWTQNVGGVHLNVRNGTNAGPNYFNPQGFAPPIGRVPLPVEGQPGTGRIGGQVLSNPSVPVTSGRAHLDLFQTDVTHPSTDGHDVGAFASLPSKGTQWTSGPVFNGSYIAFIEDTARQNKIVVLLQINGNTIVDLDLDAPCFGFAECEYQKGGPPSLPGGFHPLIPARILDTRTGLGHLGPGKVTSGDGASSDPNPFVRALSQANHEAQVTGVGGVPQHGVSAVVLNVTAVSPTVNSHLAVFPKPSRRWIFDDQSSFGNAPTASNLNFVAGQTVPNLVVVKVGAGGTVRMLNNAGQVDVIFDVVGWFDSGQSPGDGFTGVTPRRLLDSRDGTGGPQAKFGPGEQRSLVVRGGSTTVPDEATSVVLNVTATNTTADSHVTVWPSGQARPTASNLNFGPVQTVPNLVMVKVGTGGQVSLFNNTGNTDLVADVVGYYTASGGARFTATNPTRILDSRVGVGLAGAWGPGSARDLQVANVGVVPPGAVGVVMNTTVTQPTAGSHVTVWDTGTTRPTASNLNFAAGQTVPNLVVVKTGAGGKDSIFNNSGFVHVIADVNGYFA